MYLTAGSCYLIIGKPGHGHYWQLLAEGQHVSPPRPKSSYPLQLEVPSLAGTREKGNARELRALNEDIVRVVDVEDGIVELRRGGGQ